ncbi:MAG: DNA-binding protein [Proteobacteria bacterium]|nr:DNA-binding protein [Pseudomonadota bacterium]MBU1709924.1 DNA-binding protein [Pseudomonadota bacterium]
MDYRTGTMGRVFSARFDHQDDFLGELKELIVRENIRCGWFQVLGGMLEADVVTGPKEPVMPPEPVWKHEDTAREVLGAGSIFWDEVEPRIHLHAALGHHGDTLTACVRKGTKVYLILEAIIFEICGIDATRPWFEKGGFNRITFK